MTSGIEPGEVKFGEGKKPVGDELPTGPTQNSEPKSNVPSFKNNGIIRGLRAISDALISKPLFNNTNLGSSSKVLTVEREIDWIVPYCIKLSKTAVNRTAYQVNGDFSYRNVVSALEDKFGEDIWQTDIPRKLGLGSKTVDEERFFKIFREAQETSTFIGKYGAIRESHYLTLLALPFEVREFFLGAHQRFIETLNERPAINSTGFFRPLTTEQLIEYSKQTNTIHEIGEILETYNNAGL